MSQLLDLIKNQVAESISDKLSISDKGLFIAKKKADLL